MIESDKLIQMISDKLREEKYNVINQNQELLIKLSSSCSVTAHIVDNHLEIKAKYGKMERAKAIALSLFGAILLIAMSFISIVGPLLLLFAVIIIVSEFMQWQKSQHVIKIISNTYKELFNT